MEQKYDRREEILQSMQPYMEERFQESGSSIQKKLEKRGNEFWDGMHGKIERIFVQVRYLQERGQKGEIAYLVCSFMQCGIYLNRLLLHIEALDEGFYLDEQETADCYDLQLLQDAYQGDMEFLHRKVLEKFIRVQDYELDEVSKVYSGYYNALMYRIMKSMGSLIMRTVSESGVRLSDSLRIMYGEYMGSVAVIYVSDAA